MTMVQIGRRSIELTAPNKILFPQFGITKKEFVAYYRKIAPVMVLHVKDRPLTMHRFVHGIAQEGFYQKDASDYFPDWIVRKRIKKKDGGFVRYVVCNDAATLVYLANQLCITPHVWLSRIDKLHYPDRMIFDLDPGSKTDFSTVCFVAKQLRAILDDEGLVPFVKTTGSRGLHVVVPLKRTKKFAVVRAYAKEIAQELVATYPQKLTLEIRKAKREGKLFIDTLRNSYGATAVAAYAVRARSGAPIATPLEWAEIRSGLTPDKYTIKNIFRRLSRVSDPWKQMYQSACTLPLK